MIASDSQISVCPMCNETMRLFCRELLDSRHWNGEPAKVTEYYRPGHRQGTFVRMIPDAVGRMPSP